MAAGLSKEALSKRADFRRTYAGSVERAQRNIPIRNLFKLAQGLSVDPREFFASLRQRSIDQLRSRTITEQDWIDVISAET